MTLPAGPMGHNPIANQQFLFNTIGSTLPPNQDSNQQQNDYRIFGKGGGIPFKLNLYKKRHKAWLHPGYPGPHPAKFRDLALKNGGTWLDDGNRTRTFEGPTSVRSVSQFF